MIDGAYSFANTPVEGFFVGIDLCLTNVRTAVKSNINSGKISLPSTLVFVDHNKDIVPTNQQMFNYHQPEDDLTMSYQGATSFTLNLHQNVFKQSENAICQNIKTEMSHVKDNNGYNFNIRVRYHKNINNVFFLLGATCGFINKHCYNLNSNETNVNQQIGNASVYYKNAVINNCYILQVKFGGLNCDLQLGIGKTNGLYYFAVYGACLVSNLIIQYRPDEAKEQYDKMIFENGVQLCANKNDTINKIDRVSLQEGAKLERSTTSGKMVKIRTWKKSKFVLSFGIGAEIGIAVARNVIAGIGVVVYPACTGKMSVPGYQNAVLHDPYQFGATHHVKVQTLKMYLFVMYKPGMLNKKQIAIKQEANCKICHSQQTTSKYNNFAPKYRHKLSKKNALTNTPIKHNYR